MLRRVTRQVLCRARGGMRAAAIPNAMVVPRVERVSSSVRWCTGEAANTEGDFEAVKPIPVTVITGFLGSGKTTLLNHLLRNNKGRKFAVIENEIGEIGIDDMLVHKEKGDENIFELNNGCLCCTVRTDLIEILGRLAERPDLDAVIVETTGLADPSPIVQTFMMQDKFVLDGVVTVVDSLNVRAHLEDKVEGSEVVNQIGFADRIILNKVDALSNPEDIHEVRSMVQAINSTAQVIETSSSVVEPATVLDVNAFDIEKVKELLKDTGHDHDHHHHDHDHHHHDHHHHAPHAVKNSVTTICFNNVGDVNPAGFAMFLDTVLSRFGDQLYRYKGVISAKGEPSKLVLQGVPNLRSGPFPLEPWTPEDTRQTKLVFIGKNLDEDLLRDGFNRCIAPETLRFKEGDEVLCAADEGTMSPGTVIALWDQGYPYKIKLEALNRAGYDEVWAPFDEDMFITHA